MIRYPWKGFFFGCIIGFCFFVAGRGTGQAEDTATALFNWTQSIEKSLQADSQTIEFVNNLKSSAKVLQDKVSTEINSYRIQEPIFGNQLLNPAVSLKTIEESYANLAVSYRSLNIQLGELKAKQEEAQKIFFQISELNSMAEGQIQNIPPGAESDPAAKAMVKRLKDFSASLAARQAILQSVLDTYAEVIKEATAVAAQYDSLAKQFQQMIESRTKQELLERKKLFESMGFRKIIADMQVLPTTLKTVLTMGFWSEQFRFVDTSEDLLLGPFSLVMMIVMALAFRIRIRLNNLMTLPALSDKKWTRLVVMLQKRSLPLIGLSLFFYIILQLERFQPQPAILEVVLNLLMLWLFTKWFVDAMKLLTAENQSLLHTRQLFWLRVEIQIVRLFSVFYILVAWLYDGDSAIVILGRIVFALCLYAVTIVFWRVSESAAGRDPSGEEQGKTPSGFWKRAAILRTLTYVIIICGFVLDVTGYGSLAQLWFESWGLTLVAGLWGGLTFKAIREWNTITRKRKEIWEEEVSQAKDTVQWMAVQLLTLAWFAVFLILFVLSWGGKKAVFIGMLDFIRMPLTLGAMKFSILGFLIAVPILLATRGIARVWRHVFYEKFLGQSGMEEGLKESVTTISVYAIWGVGIMLSLNALGFDATSLTVVLGALGIGIGFGLQNIFNNFLSGIILLFERPIQVGDEIEVNGVWATVKKINVRSTVVQTYDNASLIIPNSDLISAQVTNWSFKDRRLRRNVEVGVAYGSDVELVRTTLLEVADRTSRVLKFPKPDVIFKDFGDSALIFRLRIWTRVDYFYAVETEIRYGIDRLFRERGIVIAFPQMDVHIDRIQKNTVEESQQPQTADAPDNPDTPSGP